jgi:hypothetical protein
MSDAGRTPQLCAVVVPQSPQEKGGVQCEQAMRRSRGTLRHPVDQFQQAVAEIVHCRRLQRADRISAESAEAKIATTQDVTGRCPMLCVALRRGTSNAR